MSRFIRWFDEVGNGDVEIVGGKCASLGEMICNLVPKGIAVPMGFAVTAEAYRHFVRSSGLEPVITDYLVMLQAGELTLAQAGRKIRTAIVQAPWPDDLEDEIRAAYADLSQRDGRDATDVAVRSSATAEDLPDASFAGQQDTYLNMLGTDAVLDATRRCFASLFTDRAITYRRHQGFDHLSVALAVAVQKMVRSDAACAGTMFTLDTETGFPHVVVIDASWGLGESVVGGHVTPDEYRVFKGALDREGVLPVIEKRLGAKQTKLIYAGEVEGHTERVRTPKSERDQFTLTDAEATELARWAVKIEEHYGRPMDIEWARDGLTGQLFITQARPETVQSRRQPGATLQTWSLEETGEVLVEGVAVGHGIASGTARVLYDPADAANTFQDGEVLVTPMTDPDWVPLMERASAIVTDAGGRTSHAAIISRELGVPAIVGCGDATRKLETGDVVTVSCAEGDRGNVYEGKLAFSSSGVDMDDLPETRTKVLMIAGSPQTAYRWWRVPCEGVGLARMEFIINNVIRVHPLALLHFDEVADDEVRWQIEKITRGYADKPTYFVDKLARAMAGIAAAQWPHPVIVRMSDFKSNEYADLIGGRQFEPVEHNPMLGFRGASRYYSDKYREGFALECRALRMAREQLGMTNLVPMIPFCRTPAEADKVLAEMKAHGLERGKDGLQVYVMVEVPSNVILADQFAERFDGFSIGSNDLTQLVLGIDRDSGDLAHLFDSRDEAVKRMIRQVIEVANRTGTKIGICGQAPSDHPEFARFLVECGIDTIAVNPDSLVEVRRHIAAAESRR
jgi:pyruvate,water dikinase